MSRIIKIVICALCVILCLSGCVNQIEDGNVSIDVSPNGQQVVFSSADGDLYLLDLKTSAVTQLTKTETTETTPAFSPDGKTIVYSVRNNESSSSGWHLSTLSIADKHVTQITFEQNVSDYSPSYSKDGKLITFTRANLIRPYSMGGWTSDNYDAYIVNSQGGDARHVTHNNYSSQDRPHFLSKTSLLYGASCGGMCLFKAHIPTGESRNLTPKSIPHDEGYSLGSDADVSPDGKKVVFVSDRVEGFAYDLFLMNSDGTKQTPLTITRFSHSNQNPVFMPDGKSILFLAGLTSNASGRYILSLWKVNTDGTAPHQIADTELFSHPLTWKHSH